VSRETSDVSFQRESSIVSRELNFSLVSEIYNRWSLSLSKGNKNALLSPAAALNNVHAARERPWFFFFPSTGSGTECIFI